jgi:hypothetical protein
VIAHAAHFVDLIDQNEGVLGLALLESLDDATGERTNIGSAVTLNLCHIVHTTHAEAVVLAVKCSCDGLSDRSFTNTGRSD